MPDLPNTPDPERDEDHHLRIRRKAGGFMGRLRGG
jgi:hypothetical protein